MLESLFYKITGRRPITLFKRDSGADIFLCKLRNFQEHLFIEHIRVTASAIHRLFFFRTLDYFIYNKCVTSGTDDARLPPFPPIAKMLPT